MVSCFLSYQTDEKYKEQDNKIYWETSSGGGKLVQLYEGNLARLSKTTHTRALTQKSYFKEFT